MPKYIHCKYLNMIWNEEVIIFILTLQLFIFIKFKVCFLNKTDYVPDFCLCDLLSVMLSHIFIVYCISGMLPYLSTRNFLQLLSCLENSYAISSQFDCRPGLKFLVQKVARADVATNLYRYSGLALTFLMHTLIVVSAHMEGLSLENSRKQLSSANTQGSIQRMGCDLSKY